MTPEEQRIAIAEACGWTEIHEELVISCNQWCGHPPSKGTKRIDVFIPDYLNDLNAMHEAEKALTLEQLRRMTVEIHDIMTRDPKQDWIPVHHCTAAQRAEAFLRTLGKWRDGSV